MYDFDYQIIIDKYKIYLKQLKNFIQKKIRICKKIKNKDKQNYSKKLEQQINIVLKTI